MKKIIFIILIFILITYFLCYLYFNEKNYYQGSISDHFNGKKFYDINLEKNSNKKFFSYFKSKIDYEKKHGKTQWQDQETLVNQTIPENIISNTTIHATFVGHSTFLIQLQGLNILTDPIWSKRASPLSFIGPIRAQQVGIKFENLPKIDLVLISHSHYDHMDIPTIKKLKDHSNPKFLTGLGNCYYLNHLKKLKINCTEMDWQEKFTFEKITINFLKAQHWSKRSFFGSNASLWGAFAIQSKIGNIYFAGDTGYNSHFQDAYNKIGKFKLALLPIGAYKPEDFMFRHHTSPKQAIQAHLDLHAEKSIAMHYGTFKLGTDNFDDPINDLNKFKKELNLEKNFITLKPGEKIIIN